MTLVSWGPSMTALVAGAAAPGFTGPLAFSIAAVIVTVNLVVTGFRLRSGLDVEERPWLIYTLVMNTLGLCFIVAVLLWYRYGD